MKRVAMFCNFGCLLISRAGCRSENLKRVLWEDMSLLARIVCTKNRAITGTYGPRHKRLTPGQQEGILHAHA